MIATTRLAQAAAVAAIGLFAAGPALAVSVSNMSDKAMEVTADLGENEPKTKIDAGKTVKIDCPEGCELRVPTISYGLAATKGDKVVIGKDGVLAYEGQEQEARNDTGAAEKSKAN
ncbi:hypothetical protein GCM10008171_07470 [Methylopila jiangsuensis]|uniref:Uncharacterized protein n=1 Tax=Methylopila jiangsuensis TaxID=586230 RepID=A0A9W6N2Q7_9HYPH|nr:hypothetical protein [Methylopila jiangsuensis]MDR6285736.1 hypothetical protein [Methylopila jiangsuensis]GLK75493.1 hypothetical protein GCM10008171_07470 [Methylopila jiangsuensis]